MGDVGDFLTRISPPGSDPVVLMEGEKPESSRTVRDIAPVNDVPLVRSVIGFSHVYMFLRDSRAIYIGMSRSPADRFSAHSSKVWFPVANEYVLVRFEGRDSDGAARHVEREAIRMFGPTHNVAGLDRYGA